MISQLMPGRPAAFLTPFDVRLVDDNSSDGRGTWRLLQDLVFWSALMGQTITVPKDFITDFASVPKWIPIASGWLQDRAHAAAAIHDFLYTVQVLTREQSDEVLREAALVPVFGAEKGCPAWVAWCLYNGVRIGGASHWVAPGQVQPPTVQRVIAAAQPQEMQG